MAIARGAGTEIIRTVLARGVNSTIQKLIIGVQHHIYTVLSIIVHAETSATSGGSFARCRLVGYDAKGGTTDGYMTIFIQDMQAAQTFVWNDKFSFNGYEAANFTGPMDDATKQDAIADQGAGAGNEQYLFIQTEDAGDDMDVIVTFIDQNNS